MSLGSRLFYSIKVIFNRKPFINLFTTEITEHTENKKLICWVIFYFLGVLCDLRGNNSIQDSY